MNPRNRSRCLAPWLGKLFCVIAILPSLAIAAWPNDRLIVTDMLDDDIRALIHLFSDPQKRKTIKAIVVSTGNTKLKAAVARAMVETFGLDIPVYAGTSTDLADNPTTRFAANFESEGKHVLDEDTRQLLKERYGESGDAAQQIQSLIKSHSKNNPLDVVLLTAPTDLVSAMKADPVAAKGSLGDLFAMGLYKQTPTGKLTAPYNTMAGPQSVFELMKLYNEGSFSHIYHVPSDTVQNRSGLPGGYFPEGAEGQALRAGLAAIMKMHPALARMLKAAQEYGLSWWTSAAQDFGTGLTDDSRWVAGTLKEPKEAAGFYLADTIPSLLSNMTADELAKLDTHPSRVVAPDPRTTDTHKPFEFGRPSVEEEPTVRPFIDLNSFDGRGAIHAHMAQLAEISPSLKVPVAEYPLHPVSHLPDQAHSISAQHFKDLDSSALVMTFKNSPDDWFALLRTISSEKGREALARGGIITEGFETHEMALTVKAVLEHFGLSDVPVAAGYQYSSAEVQGISNFKGELSLYANNQAFRAFQDLPELKKLKSGPVALSSPKEILDRSGQWAHSHAGKIDLMILGEGIDSLRVLRANSALADLVGSAYVMGGGRNEGNNKIKFTRNWIVHREEVLKGLEHLGKKGAKVYVFSTDEFGGLLIANTEASLGNGAVAFKALEKHANDSAIRAIHEHWANWTRTFNWVIKADGTPFDSGKPVTNLTVAPLGLHVADAWNARFIETGRPDWHLGPFSPSHLTATGTLGTDPALASGVFWVQQKGGQKVESAAARLEESIRKIVEGSDFIHRLSKLSDIDMIRQMMSLKPELKMLTGNVAATPDAGEALSEAEVLSRTLFGNKHAEFDRTALAILTIKWILEGNYDALTGPQAAEAKLRPESFEWLRQLAAITLKDPEAVDAMLTYMAIHDLGKVNAFEARARELGIRSANHDVILSEMLAKHHEVPSYDRLSPQYRKLIQDILKANFNLAQFMQGENVPASLEGLKGLGPEARAFYMFHVLADIAGAKGHLSTKGSMVLTESTLQNFRLALESLAGLSHGKSVEEVYDDYLAKQGSRLEIATNSDLGKAMVRISLMIRASDPATAQRAAAVLRSLDEPTREILVKNLNASGTHGSKATLLYYSPALLSNAVQKASQANPSSGLEQGLSDGLHVMAALYREAEKSPATNGVVTVNVKALAELAASGKIAGTKDAIQIVFESPTDARARSCQKALEALGSNQPSTVVFANKR